MKKNTFTKKMNDWPTSVRFKLFFSRKMSLKMNKNNFKNFFQKTAVSWQEYSDDMIWKREVSKFFQYL